VREHHRAFERLSPGGRAQLATLLPGLGGEQLTNGEPPVGASGQVRLFEALLELLDALSEERPLVLILEDMHWADRSTRTFAAFVARTLRSERVMLLLSYRTDELHRRHALRPLLAELDRLGRARRIDLRPFDRPELAEALSDILGEAPGAHLIERLYMRAEGNPLYTEELLAAGLDGRGAAPQSLRDAFLLRIERLSPDARQAARLVAVGRRLDYQMIATLTALETEQLNDALRETIAEQVLLTDGDDRFHFRHALLREALYDDLLPGERSDFHQALAAEYESRTAPDDETEAWLANSIATHYAAAGDQPAALRATVRAAKAARGLHAFGEAADLAERALELWPRVPDAAEQTGMDEVALLALAARAHVVAGDRSRSDALLGRALGLIDPAADPVRYARLLARRARAQWNLNRGVEALETAREALTLLPAGEAPRERASLLSWLARTRYLRGRFREAVCEGEEALEAAVATGDPTIESEALNTLGMARIAGGAVDEGVSCLRRALELARANDALDDAAFAYSNLADMLLLAGRTEDALQTIKEGYEETPSRIRGGRDWIELTMSDIAYESGDWELARSHLHPSPARQVGLMEMFSQLRQASQALGEGRHEDAQAALDAIEPLVKVSPEPQWHGAYGSLLAELRRREGDLDGARSAVANALDELETCTDDVMRIARVTAAGLAIEADRALRAHDLREESDARQALSRARIHLQRLRAASEEGGPVERAWLAIGSAELARGRRRNDPKLWRKAAVAWDELGRPYQAALARWREAEALIEAGDRAAAAVAAGAALEFAERVGAGWLDGELVALAGRGRLAVPAGSGDGAADGDAARAPVVVEDPFGLTERERQVLALVAEGATNRQIGSALYMAEKTASVHVSRILAKLGVQSRTQAAAVAHRQHLA
jgi:ATP/maltotriose-dependent transcriptional regulator MalT